VTRAARRLLIAALLAGATRVARAEIHAPPRVPRPPYAVSAGLSRNVAKLGERVAYHGWITGGGPGRIRFLPPESGGVLSWGPLETRSKPRIGTRRAADPAGRYDYAAADTLFVDLGVQCFALGEVAIPGLRVEIDDGSGPRLARLPTLRMLVAPVLSAADSAADLRPPRGPLAAPWWERVPWLRVAFVVIGLAALIAAVVALRRRRRRAAPAVVPARAPRDPAAEALAALAALRRLALPEQERFSEHAFQLGRIVRRFLEATAGTPRPGDTTPEFVRHLEIAALDRSDLERIEGLMRFWDRVKFARAPETREEAARAEDAVEKLVRRLSPAPRGQAA
jgi:hypothetical protein